MDPVDYNFVHSIHLFGSTTTRGQVLDTRDFVASNSTAKVAEFNQAALKQPGPKLERTLDQLEDYYRRAQVPYRVHVLSDGAAVTEALLARGYTRSTDLPCMVFDAPRCEAPAVPGLQIRAVGDAGALADFQRVAFESFGYPLQLAPHALTAQLLATPELSAFVGYVNGQPACCSAILTTGRTGGVYWVGALAAHRRLGMGAAITAHAVNAARERDCSRVCLQASAMGAPVYHRLGFTRPRTYLRFDRTAPEAQAY